jgi:hypothetical protein
MRTGSLRSGALALAALAIGVAMAFGLGGAAGAQNAPTPCTLRVPDHPLTAQGLATPWELSGPCHEANADTAAFVQAAVVDGAGGQMAVYDPLVVDRGTSPAVAPTMPALPANGVVGIWIGFNGNNLALDGPGSEGCVQGVRGSRFGQNAFCNAAAFFAAANDAIKAGKLKPPPLGTAHDGKPCPTVRDFSVVDQDQSDNTTDQYLITAAGRIAQDTPQNRSAVGGTAVATFNGSDERLLSIALDRALGCTPWAAPDLADPTHAQQQTAAPLNELQAAAEQAQPMALVPALDPFVLTNGEQNLDKLNAYRAGVDQPPAGSLRDADTRTYCDNLLHVGLPRIAQDRSLTAAAASPFPNMATNLFTFLASRFHATFSNADGFLRCTHLLHVRNPVHLVTNNAGVVVGADIHPNPHPAANETDEGTDDSE